MHILLTDILTCPRCGPQFGLILLADRVHERRVESGVLGCSNCREKYAVRDHVGWFGGEQVPESSSSGYDVERLAALVGIAQGPANVLFAGPAAAAADRISALLDAVEIVAVGAGRAGAVPGSTGGVSRIVTSAKLPLASGKLAGAALTGAAADVLLEEAARAVSPVGRLVLQPVPADAQQRLEAAGMRIAAQEGDTAVATR